MSEIIFSCIIPASAKDLNSQNLKDLIASINAQDFPKDKIEILVITRGDSEQAKAIGIREARGDICAMFCADNQLMTANDFSALNTLFNNFPNITGIYSRYYAVIKSDNSLNRYFSLIGNNDPIAFYLKKADRRPYWESWDDPNVSWSWMSFHKGNVPSLGDNGFYYRRKDLLNGDLTHYYPMDVVLDLAKMGKSQYLRTGGLSVWHRTSDNLFTFLAKRYRYARDLYCDRNDRRWKMLDTGEDYWRLFLYVLATATGLPCLLVSIRGFLKIKDWAWFWHWPVCVGFLVTYSILAIRNLFKHGRLFQCSPVSLSQPLAEARA